MAKHIVIFFASPYSNNASVSRYTDTTGSFAAECEQTNETALKYIKWKLAQQQQEITAAYAFTTKAVQEQDFRRLCKRFGDESYFIKPIYFDEQSTIEGSFNSINIMFGVLQQAYAAEENVTIHMDLTGGFRHSTVLMLALLQLLQYAGYHLGLVTYTNFNEKRIETVNELLGMFNLISGTADFAHNGSVQQLQQFFATTAPSLQLQSLLVKMAYFSECIKSCSHRSTLLDAVQSLRQSLEVYKNSLAALGSAVGEQEAFFAGLLPVIERDYADIFACDTSVKTIPTLLNWCLPLPMLPSCCRCIWWNAVWCASISRRLLMSAAAVSCCGQTGRYSLSRTITTRKLLLPAQRRVIMSLWITAVCGCCLIESLRQMKC